MAFLKFSKNDTDFFNWLKQNPNGYFLNVNNSKTNIWMHKAPCHLFKPHKNHNLKGNPFTSKQYFKVCSEKLEDLENFIKIEINEMVKAHKCKFCFKETQNKAELTYDPNEINIPEKYFEGAVTKVFVNNYERNPNARIKCIEKYGVKCVVCGFVFSEKYGDLGRNFIHVHHLTPLSAIREEYKIDPVNHLRPVCPNCHCMLHQSDPPMEIEELRKIVTGTI